MTVFQTLAALTMTESIFLLLAGLVWRERIAMLALRLLGLGTPVPSDEQYAGRLADAFRRVKWLKEKSALEAGNTDAAPYEEALSCLQRAGKAFRSRPDASVQLGDPLLRSCELLALSLERQMTEADLQKSAAAAAAAAAASAAATSAANAASVATAAAAASAKAESFAMSASSSAAAGAGDRFAEEESLSDDMQEDMPEDELSNQF